MGERSKLVVGSVPPLHGGLGAKLVCMAEISARRALGHKWAYHPTNPNDR